LVRSSATLDIRDAVEADAETIARLHAASWRVAYRGILPAAYLDGPIDDERRRHWQATLAARRPDDVVLVIEDQANSLGFIAVWRAGDPGFEAYIDNLHVRPDLRGNGLGRRLLAAAVARLRTVGCRSVYLWLFEKNAAARRFYETLGGCAEDRSVIDFAGARISQIRIVWRDLAALLDACQRTRES
jgi:ribosomal protein S18 acetylase RimI-like enzyme